MAVLDSGTRLVVTSNSNVNLMVHRVYLVCHQAMRSVAVRKVSEMNRDETADVRRPQRV